jgi:hypothetical protein
MNCEWRTEVEANDQIASLWEFIDDSQFTIDEHFTF